MDDCNTNNCTADNCTDLTLDKNQIKPILYVMCGTGAASFFACILTICLLFCLKLHKSFIYRLAMYQVISSMLVSIVDVCSVIATTCELHKNLTCYNNTCMGIAITRTYAEWVKLLFTFFLTLHLFLMVVYLREYKKREILTVLVSIVFPFLICWVPGLDRIYYREKAWCWIMDKDNNGTAGGFPEELGLWYSECLAFLVVCIVFTTIIIICSIRRGRKKRDMDEQTQVLIQSQNNHNRALLEIAPLLLYPVIFLVFICVELATRTSKLNCSKTDTACLVFKHGATNGLWGFCSSLAVLAQITLTKWLKKRYNGTYHALTVQQADTTDGTSIMEVNYNLFNGTSDYSSGDYIIPRESEVDDMIEDQIETRIKKGFSEH